MNRIPTAADILSQLERILACPEFAASGRLSEFLRFVVAERLAGHEVKEYLIGVEAYHKGRDYDPRTDPTVRVDARKVRARLAKYYENQGLNDPILITIRKGTYVPEFEYRGDSAPPLPAPRPFHWKLTLGAVLALAGVLGAVELLLNGPSSNVPANKFVTLSPGLGEPADPSFSPDGSMVAFSWNGEREDNFDIYVKVVDAPGATRLTTDPGRDVAPAWSPDGRRIAFLRNPGPSGAVYLIPALGGSEQRVTTSGGSSVGWSADSKSLLVADRPSPGEPFAGFRVPLESGERMQLTFPLRESFYGDFDFIGSPDGTRIAFTRQVRPPLTEIFLMPSAGGTAYKVAQSTKYISGTAWTPDSREIVFSSRQSGVNALWRMRIDPPSPPLAIPGLETDAIRPSIPRFGTAPHIAYQRVESCYRMWHAVISGGRMSQPQCILPSRRFDSSPQISPDRQSIVFASDRTGSFDIWVSRLDGSGPRDLTAGSGLNCGSPRWSPDGTTIVFDAHRDAESYDIYDVSASGGPLRQLTREPSSEVRPSWSHDGKWIYFASDRTGDMEIWKIPAAGDGAELRMTKWGGFEAFESPDGKVLYFVKRGSPSSVLSQMPSVGGKETFVSDAVRDGRWSVTPSGIFFIDALHRICKLGAGRQNACIGTIAREGTDSFGLTVSPDGKDIVYVQPEPTRSDLRMAEGRLF